MSSVNKTIKYRCPVCFARENDVPLHQKGEGDFYCVKCSFTGDEAEILKSYDDLKQKYHNRTKRITLEEIEEM